MVPNPSPLDWHADANWPGLFIELLNAGFHIEFMVSADGDYLARISESFHDAVDDWNKLSPSDAVCEFYRQWKEKQGPGGEA